MWEEGEGPSLGPAPPFSCYSVSRAVGMEATRQGQPLHILGILLQGMAIKRISMLPYETIV
jgi:hypothetical protein